MGVPHLADRTGRSRVAGVGALAADAVEGLSSLAAYQLIRLA